MNDLNIKYQRVLVHHYFDESCQKESDALELENPPFILVHIMLGAKGYNRVSFPNQSPDLDYDC